MCLKRRTISNTCLWFQALKKKRCSSDFAAAWLMSLRSMPWTAKLPKRLGLVSNGLIQTRCTRQTPQGASRTLPLCLHLDEACHLHMLLPTAGPFSATVCPCQ